MDYALPKKVEQCLAFLDRLYWHEAQIELRTIIVNASAKVDPNPYENCYANDDDVSWGHYVHLELPEDIFLQIFDHKNDLEARLCQDLNKARMGITDIQDEYFFQVSLEHDFKPKSNWRSESGLLIKSSRAADIGASKTLGEMIREKDVPSVEQEYVRAMDALEKDPPASLTAACSIIESICKIFIEEHGLDKPKDESIKPLWNVVSKQLNLDPGNIHNEDKDLKTILSGMSAIIDGIGALRTHAGTAHGRGGLRYNIQPRHASLAVHASHTLATYLFECWDNKLKHATDT